MIECSTARQDPRSSQDHEYSTWPVRNLLSGLLRLYLVIGHGPPTFTSRPPDIIHVIGVPRPSPFFALFRFRVLYWMRTKEQKTGEAWERGYKTTTGTVSGLEIKQAVEYEYQ